MYIYNRFGRTLFAAVKRALGKAETLKFIEGDVSKGDASIASLLSHFRAECFTVAGIMELEAKQKLKEVLAGIISSGESNVKEEFLKKAYPIIAEYVPVDKFPSPHFLNTNVQTAVSSSYLAGQYSKLQKHPDKYPLYKYMTRGDDHVRDAHRALHGKIFRADSEVWQTILPPNGWNCRCYIVPISSDEVTPDQLESSLINERDKEKIITEAKIEPDFSRNAADTKSIWQKWLQEKIKTGETAKVEKDIADYVKQNKVILLQPEGFDLGPLGGEVWVEVGKANETPATNEIPATKETQSPPRRTSLQINVIRFVEGKKISVNGGEAISVAEIDRYRKGVPLI